MINHSNINIEFEVGLFNGSMALEISDPSRHIMLLENIKQSNLIVSFDIEFPTVLTFNITNKNSNKDTVVDDQGKIISDKYIKIKSLHIGRVPVRESLLFDICKYRYNGNEVNNIFWAFNGNVCIDFDADDFISWHIKHNNLINY